MGQMFTEDYPYIEYCFCAPWRHMGEGVFGSTYGDYLSQFPWDSPENGLKIACDKTGLKCSAISKMNFIFIKFNW
jgi:hypothetical protein